MFLPPLVDPLTDAEMIKLIADMKAKNKARGQINTENDHGCVSEYSVWCAKCGFVVLSENEAITAWNEPHKTPPCPICGSANAKYDKGVALKWNHQARKFLWSHLWA